MVNLIKNNSIPYANGTVHINEDGDMGIIIGKVDKERNGEYRWFLLQVNGKAIVELEYTTIKRRLFVDPLKKIVEIEDIMNPQFANKEVIKYDI